MAPELALTPWPRGEHGAKPPEPLGGCAGRATSTHGLSGCGEAGHGGLHDRLGNPAARKAALARYAYPAPQQGEDQWEEEGVLLGV